MRRMYSENQLENKVKSVQKDITTLVDKDGHDRFIEGDINIETITGVSKKYGKWSLSGSHLLIVLVLSMEVDADLANSDLVATINIPEWILNKIAPVWSTAILYYNGTFRDDSWNALNCNFTLRKEENPSLLQIRCASNITNTSAKKYCRIALDLLIDNN